MTDRSLRFVDIGINLAHDSYDHDRASVIESAIAAGVERLVVTGSSIESTRQAIELARQWPGRLHATAGIHPHHAETIRDEDWPVLVGLLDDPAVVSAGECGLDYFRNFSSPHSQRVAFERQLELAVAAGKPVFLHQRDAHADFLAILDRFLPRLPRAVVHCFTGTGPELDDYIARDLYVGITGWICDERRGAHLKPLMSRIPANRLLIETDGPYLLPRDLMPKPQSRRNEPRFLPHIAAEIARQRGENLVDLSDTTYCNSLHFFSID